MGAGPGPRRGDLDPHLRPGDDWPGTANVAAGLARVAAVPDRIASPPAPEPSGDRSNGGAGDEHFERDRRSRRGRASTGRSEPGYPTWWGRCRRAYPTLNGSTIKRTLRREIPDQLFRTDGGDDEGAAVSLIDIAYLQRQRDFDYVWEEDVPADAGEA